MKLNAISNNYFLNNCQKTNTQKQMSFGNAPQESESSINQTDTLSSYPCKSDLVKKSSEYEKFLAKMPDEKDEEGNKLPSIQGED